MDVNIDTQLEDAFQQAIRSSQLKIEKQSLEFLQANNRLRDEIENRKRVEDALKRSEEDLRIVLNTVPAMIWYKDTKNRIMKVNQVAAESMGFAVEEIEGKSTYDLYPGEASQYYADDMEVINTGNPKYGIVEQYHQMNGEIRWVKTDKVPFRDMAGNIIGVIVFSTDITDLKKAQDLIEASEARYRMIVQISNNGIWDLDLCTGAMYWNDRLYEILEIPRTTAPNIEQVIPLMHPEDKPLVLAALKSHLKADQPSQIQCRVRSQTAGYRYCEIRASVQRDTSGQAIRMAGLVRDISEERQAEETLRESEERFRTMADCAPVMIWLTDTQGSTTYLNRAWQEFTGLDFDKLSRDWELYVHPEDREKGTRIYEEALANRRNFESEGRFMAADGQYHWIYSYASPRYTASGKYMGFIGTCIDITKRKKAEEELKIRVYQQEVVAEFGQRALDGIDDINELISEAVILACETLNIKYSCIFQLTPDKQHLLLRECQGYPRKLIGLLTLGTGLNSQAGYTLYKNEPVITEDFGKETRFNLPPIRSQYNIVSGLCVPIFGKYEPFGVLSVYTDYLHPFTQDDANYLQAIANVLAMAIERKKLELDE